MAAGRRGAVGRTRAMWFSLIALAGLSVWGFQNRATLAACLNTIEGVTTKLAHLNQPFGLGANVESSNPVLGVVPEFSLTERSGRPVRNSDLLGGYWVASFIFTRCATSCPIAVRELARLQADLPPEIRLVSFSVDPEYDSPEVLAAFAERNGANVDRWLFLTGEKTSVYRSIREGFHLAVEENSGAVPGMEVSHTPRFALVDPKGRIRGYYESSVATDLERLRADVARLSRPEHRGG
jgi:cytochrome oxidase Cu insertion factor (SCO1/SenC/PrrC family)